MGRAILHEDLAAMFAERDRRLDNLENTSRLASSSIRDGTLQIQNVQAQTLGVFGTQSDGSQGILITDASGQIPLLQASGAGLLHPELQGASRDPAAFKAVTGGAFATQYQVAFGQIVSPSVEILISYSVDVGTTGEVRLISNGGTNSSAFTLGSGASGFNYIDWLHNLSLLAGPLFIGIDARRTSGAGNVNIYLPVGWFRDPNTPPIPTLAGIFV